jgi:hypothetical protein
LRTVLTALTVFSGALLILMMRVPGSNVSAGQYGVLFARDVATDSWGSGAEPSARKNPKKARDCSGEVF